MSQINRGNDDKKLVLRIRVRKPDLAAVGKVLFFAPKNAILKLFNAKLQWRLLVAAFVLVVADFYGVLSPFFEDKSYALGSSEVLLGEPSPEMASKVRYDSSQQLYNFDPAKKQVPGQMGVPDRAPAKLYKDAKKGVIVSDPVNSVDFKMTPKFQVLEGRQDKDRIVYPLANGSGWLVYTLRGVGVKEDIILKFAPGDTASYSYDLNLGSGLQAKLEKDGSLGIYGNTLLSGNISAGTEKDAELLKKARDSAKKDTLLFVIPAPVVNDKQGPANGISAKYTLEGNELTVTATGLKKGNYPLAIDPSIYVVTASQFMQGNNETNINFDVDNKLIKKGRTTGARFDEWNSTTGLPTPVWGAGTVAAGGYIYSVGGEAVTQQIYSSQGTSSFTVPEGVTSISVKMWGGGGGGGGGGDNGPDGLGGAGGGGGYVTATLSVTPGEDLSVYVGGGGQGGNYHSGGNDAGGGGGGGGYSSLNRGGTLLALAAGGGGGGGARDNTTGGIGGPGGCTSSGASCNGTTVENGGGGGGATTGGGGAAGAGATNSGSAGASLAGGAGADGRSSQGSDGSGAAGGLASGGNGGQANINTTIGGGGGGGAGYFGGGGGGTDNDSGDAGGGGGGGANQTGGGASGVTHAIGSGTSPGNAGDANRSGAGDGGGGGAAFGNGSPGDNGLVLISWGTGGAETTGAINWAKLDTGNGTIVNANPGTGPCSGWCSSSEYSLPDNRSHFSLVAYNGFLYAMGGRSANCTTGNGTGNNGTCDTVYIAKLGANGQPQLWHPTDTNPNNWVYWYRDADLTSERAYSGAVAYNNRMYLVGGRTNSGPVSTVQVADIIPNGKLSTWTSSTSFGSNIYAHSVQVYNDRLYVIGGATSVGGAPVNSVYYNKINNNGTLNSWVQTTSFSTGRMSLGGNFSVIWGAYIYLNSGCTAVNASGHCTNIASDAQVASINADGSLDVWNNMAGLSDTRIGFNLFAWRDNIYAIGGCAAQNSTTGACTTALDTITYGTVNQDGDASTVGQSSASGTGTCTGGTPSDCNLPGTTYIGNMLSAAIITNGYLYIMGGCTNNACSSTSNDLIYTAISPTGKMTAPSTCSGGTIQGGIWCTRSNVLPSGSAAGSPVVFAGVIYLVGGLNGNANTNAIIRSAIDADGSPGTWSTQSMSGVGATNVSYTYAFARANPSAANTNPGNLYIFGGCTTSSDAGCSGYTGNVYKCNIEIDTEIAGCSTTNQLQIGVIPGGSNPGLAIMSGTVYAGYVYLIGGVTPDLTDLTTVRYAKIDNNNNIVAASGSAWVESSVETNLGRRRAAAFGYNGYLYVLGGYDGTGGGGVIPDIEFAKINVSDGSLDDNDNLFQVSAVSIDQRWGLSVPVSNSYAYVIGGCTAGASPSGCTTRTDIIQRFQIYNNDSGAPADFTTSANTYATNPNRVGLSSTVLNGYIYVAGGCIGSNYCTDAINTVSYAPIDAYGNIGSWSNTTANLPADRAWGKLRAAGGTLYYIGGQSNSASDYRSEIYYGTPSSGNVSSWGTASNGLPNPRTNFGAAVWNDRLYVVGGNSNSVDCTAGTCNTIYVSPQLANGGNITSAWSTGSTPFNVARGGAVAVAYANNLYLLGGFDGNVYLSDSQVAQIDTSNGLITGSWSYSTSMPRATGQGDGFAANGYVYVFGGRSSSAACDPVALAAPISANTTIASGNNPTGIGEWFETNERYTGGRFGNGVAYHDGKAYVLGGADCAVGGEYDAGGTYSYIIPQGVTSITVKSWGGGGGGGGGGGAGPGGDGGGGGYVSSTISVTSGETLSVRVGGGGSGGSTGSGTVGANGGGGGGGGYSGIFRGSTPLAIAAGGGGGGGTRPTGATGGAGGPGGCGASGATCNGGTSGGGGGGGGSTSAGGAGGGGTCAGVAGSSLQGGRGGSRNGFQLCNSTVGAGGGVNGGGGGGIYETVWNFAGGGGGGGGLYGGGGGGGSTGQGGGGGGGGSNVITGTGTTNLTANGSTPANNSDTDRGTAGEGGAGGPTNSGTLVGGNPGKVLIDLTVAYSTPVVQQTPLLSQPQVAKYSIMMDTDSDVTPTHWLLNGIDNSIGARWQLKYRSMTNPGAVIQCDDAAMSTWGQETNFGDVTLALPGIYTPRDGSGNNTGCARFFYFNVTVDAQQAFGYPDDVSRGPTITDLTLNFQADPAKRLMHGRTFVGGLQMPIDTPYYSN